MESGVITALESLAGITALELLRWTHCAGIINQLHRYAVLFSVMKPSLQNAPLEVQLVFIRLFAQTISFQRTQSKFQALAKPQAPQSQDRDTVQIEKTEAAFPSQFRYQLA